MVSKLRSGRTAPVSGFAACILLLALAPPALANPYTPNKLGDHVPNGCTHSDCTLREAITKANNHAGADTIVLRGGKIYNLGLPGDEDLNATGDLDILHSLTIKSSSKKLATVDANGIDRVFHTGPSGVANVIFKRLRIRHGSVPSSFQGGGVLVALGKVRIVQTRISGNSASTGAGVEAQDTTTIIKSTISGNRGIGDALGAGLDVSGATARVVGSTIAGNTLARDGGGVEARGGASVSIMNSTIANNRANQDGGGINTGGGTVVTLSSVTVARNRADADNSSGGTGGGLTNTGGSSEINVKNSIVALNTVGTSGANPDCSGPFNSAGVNLLTDLTGCSGFATPPNILTSHPRLGSLGDNGGPTKTIALKAGSPAINHAGSGSPSRDQRGVKRQNPDIGAYER